MKYFLMTLLLMCHTLKAAHPKDQWLTMQQVLADVELAQTAYQRVHPGYDRYTTSKQLNDSWGRIKHQAKQNNGMSVSDFYLQLSETLAMIRCDHSKAELPKSLADDREVTPVYLPFKWQYIENQVVIESATDSSGFQKGDVITHIDGETVNHRIQQLYRYVPTDGFTDEVKIHAIASSTEHRGGALDHFGALLWPTRATTQINYTDLTGNQVEKVVKRITYSAWKKLGKNRIRNFKDAVEFKNINPDLSYLRIDTFVNYRSPIKPDKLFDPIFTQLNNNPNQTLILDLRENGGGSNEPPHRLLAHLMPTKFRPAKEVRVKTLNLDGLTEHVFTWEKSALKPKSSRFTKNEDGSYSFKPNVLDDTQWIKPDKTAFNGKLIVLTSSKNSSGSTNLLSILKSRPQTTFLGEPTGGSQQGPTAGVIFFLKLPESGITTRLPVFRYYNDVTSFEPGKGISPDILVSTLKNDFINNVDTQLQAAFDLVE